MPTATEGTNTGALPTEVLSGRDASAQLVEKITHWLDEAKAENIVKIDLAGKTSIGDFMIIASGRTDRHVGSVADRIQKNIKDSGAGNPKMEGTDACDWVLIDTGDIIVHVFRPEVREFYNLEKMWQGERPSDTTGKTH